MGKLVRGKWHEGDIVTSGDKGDFQRPDSVFRRKIGVDDDAYQPEANRYHLYVSYACPWAQRTLIVRSLKGLDELISVSVVHPDMLNLGWTFATDFPGSTGDQLYQKSYLHELYQLAEPDVTTRATVPILWDKKTKTIVNNESSEIIRILNTAFDMLGPHHIDLYPAELRSEIDAINELVYHNVNNGVYRCGFARSQSAYDEAVAGVFSTLDQLDARLADRRYLMGESLTEADVRLVTTLLRFDLVYYFHFKCNLRRIQDYEHLNRYLLDLYELEAVKKTTYFDHIKRHYYYSQDSVNPFRIVPIGPEHHLSSSHAPK